MKTLHLYIITAIMVLFSACESDLLKTTIDEGTAPVLNTSSSDLVLLKTDSANMAFTLEWTDPGYLNDTSNGSISGTYVLDIDKNSDFSDPKTFTQVNNLTKSFSVYEINKILLDMGCTPEAVNAISVRLTSIFFGTDTLSSNVLSVNMTPYEVKIPPAVEVPEELWISGDALTTGWNAPFLPEQQFTKVSETEFTITIDFLATQKYEMITDSQGINWTPCYRIDPALDPAAMLYEGTFVVDGEGSEFNWGSKLFLSPPDAGTYTVTMDFQTATYTTVPQ
jgi:hypothetical protein